MPATNMTAANVLLITALRATLFIACRFTLLPLLLGEAQHASLEDAQRTGQAESNDLPAPATSSSGSNGASASGLRKQAGALLSVPRDWRTAVQSLKDPHQASSHLFSLCFEEATILFVLVFLEATGRVSTEALRHNWRFSLFGVVALAVFFIPLCICMLLTFRVEGASFLQRMVFAVPVFVAWSILFLNVPLPSALATSSGLLDAALARTALIGVVLIGLLSGSAAASSAWDTYETFFAKRKRKPVTKSEVQAAEASFHRTCSDLAARRRTLEQLRNAPSDPNSQKANLLGRWWDSSQRSKEAKSLKQEIFGLETLASAMRDDLDTLRQSHRHSLWSRTIPGKFLLGAGHLFSIYCVWRVLLAALSLLILGYKDTAPPDFVSLSLAYLVRLINVDIDLATWTRIFGLLFVGALIISRMRVVLANLSTFFRAASAGISTSFLVLFLAEILTIYLLATLIQLRASLPPTYLASAQLTADGQPAAAAAMDALDPARSAVPLLTTLPSFNVVFGALFDGVFLLAAVITGGVTWYTGRDEMDYMW